MEDFKVEIAVLKEAVSCLKDDKIEIVKEISSIEKNLNKVVVKHEQLEQRHVAHSARHENNYEKLTGKFDALKTDIDSFKTDILSVLNKMSGRDSVLKVLLGLIGGAIITLAVAYTKTKMGW